MSPLYCSALLKREIFTNNILLINAYEQLSCFFFLSVIWKYLRTSVSFLLYLEVFQSSWPWSIFLCMVFNGKSLGVADVCNLFSFRCYRGNPYSAHFTKLIVQGILEIEIQFTRLRDVT